MHIGSRKMAEKLFDRNYSNTKIIDLIERYLEDK